jgi:hypothetical protein
MKPPQPVPIERIGARSAFAVFGALRVLPALFICFLAS